MKPRYFASLFEAFMEWIFYFNFKIYSEVPAFQLITYWLSLPAISNFHWNIIRRFSKNVPKIWSTFSLVSRNFVNKGIHYYYFKKASAVRILISPKALIKIIIAFFHYYVWGYWFLKTLNIAFSDLNYKSEGNISNKPSWVVFFYTKVKQK